MGDVIQQRTDLKIGPNDILRFVLEIFAFLSLALWGFVAWPLPWNIVVGLGAPAVAILIWALFLSPKAVFGVELFVKAVLEIVVFGSAAGAWWSLGQPIVAVVFLVVAAISGVLNGRRQIG